MSDTLQEALAAAIQEAIDDYLDDVSAGYLDPRAMAQTIADFLMPLLPALGEAAR